MAGMLLKVALNTIPPITNIETKEENDKYVGQVNIYFSQRRHFWAHKLLTPPLLLK